MTAESMVVAMATFFVHALVLLSIAWAADRGFLRRRPAWRELLWRVALFGAASTASVQVLSNAELPLRVRWQVPAGQVAVPAPVQSVSASGHPHSFVAAVEGKRDAGPVSNEPVFPASVRVDVTDAPVIERPLPWAQLVLVVWLAGVALALGRLVLLRKRLGRMLARVEPLDHPGVAADAAALARQAGIAVPRLGILDDLASPIAVGRHCIVLPRWAVELLDREQLRAMLAHETAHLARNDPGWKFATMAWCAVLWFLPLVALARRRLDEIAELACDAWAARHLGSGRRLAECLAECAEHRFEGFGSVLAPAMAQRESPLLQRIDHLIGDSPMDITLSRMRAVAAVASFLAVASLSLPGFGLAVAQEPPPPPFAPPAPPAPPVPPSPPSDSGRHVRISGDISLFGGKRQYTNVQIRNGSHEISAKIKGRIEFNEREDDVASLGDDGSASFAETKGGVEHRVDYAVRDGKVEARYFVDGRERPLDTEGRTWIAAFIPVVIRDTAIGAEARVKRFYSNGGAGAVLDEIAHIQSGYARRVYLEHLFALGKLAPAEVTRAIQLIDGLDSDYERRNALGALAAVAPFDEAQQRLVIAQAEKIGSDYERAELLTGLLPRLAAKPELRAIWVAAAQKIGSDYERRRTLSALLDSGALDDGTLGEVIAASNAIGSDYERRELLVATLRRVGDGERVATAYTRAVDGIGSDYERREALNALMRAPNFGRLGTQGVLDVAGNIGSDYDCREVLVALARVMPADPALIARYREVARRLSDHERGAAERALDRFAS